RLRKRRAGAVPERAGSRCRAQRPHPRARGTRPRARALGDLQGARRNHRPGMSARRRGGWMSKDVVRTDGAPAPFQGAPYSQAIRANGLVFVSGQLGLRPGETELVEGGIAAQTEQVLANLRAILEAAGSRLHRLPTTTPFP